MLLPPSCSDLSHRARRLAVLALLLTSTLVPGPVPATGAATGAGAEHAPVTRPGGEDTADAADAAAEEAAGEEEAVRLFRQALRAVRSRYVDPVPAGDLVATAIRALVERDRWSTYLTAEEFETVRLKGDGAIVGLGLRYRPGPDGLTVTETFPGSPARAAGLSPGDIVTAIDGTPTAGMDRDTAATALKGTAGSRVTLTLARADGAAASLTLARETLTVPSVEHRALADGIGYIRIDRFDRRTPPALERAVAALRMELGDGAFRGLVLDLRGNPGGLVRAAVAIADDFLEGGTILVQDSRVPAENIRFTAEPGDILGGRPMVILVDARSASSAEILAGALKDHGRAVLVGQRTYGKGVIQTFLPVEGGGAVKLTTARYRTPAGLDVTGRGIAPDHVVPLPEEKPGDTPPAGEPALPDPTRDPQLAQALALLRGR
ncbi:MAG: hypothetical protein RLY86_951 [Pseudomonadota bacterium]|jgi:carboxyl-terminal processing protease